MQTTQENDSSPKPAEQPLFSAGKKTVFAGAVLVWIGFFLPWFSSISIFAKTAIAPGGAEIPWGLGWVVLGMAFLAVILPDALPELGARILKLLPLCALVLGALTLAFLVSACGPIPGKMGITPIVHYTLWRMFTVNGGLFCTMAGYVLLFKGVLMDFSASPPPEPRN